MASSVIWKGMQWGYQLLTKGLVVKTSTRGVNTFQWSPSSSGKFTPASANELWRQENSTAPKAAYSNAIWKLKGQTRGILLLWLTCHDRLKTRALLKSRCIVEDAICEVCGEGDETIVHALRDCILPLRIRQALLLVEMSWSHWKPLNGLPCT